MARGDWRAIVRGVAPAIARCELTYLAREPIDAERATRQHAAYRAALERAGLVVEMLAPEPDLPDAAFVEDAAVVFDEIALITRPGAPSRRREVPAVAEALARHRELVHLEEPATLDGGDVLTVGRDCYVGLSRRTNAEGARQFTTIARKLGYTVTPVEVHGCLHLKTAATALDEETLLVDPRSIGVESLADRRTLVVDEREPFAANVLVFDGLVHVSARAVRTRELLEARGFATVALEIDEFEKAEAGLTCLSLVFRAG
jgi:dimethylargininase